jgi:hypothetical protein
MPTAPGHVADKALIQVCAMADTNGALLLSALGAGRDGVLSSFLSLSRSPFILLAQSPPPLYILVVR